MSEDESGYDVVLRRPNGLTTWSHPNRDMQLARVSAVMVLYPGTTITHDKHRAVDAGYSRRLIREVELSWEPEPRTPTPEYAGPVHQCEAADGTFVSAGAFRPDAESPASAPRRVWPPPTFPRAIEVGVDTALGELTRQTGPIDRRILLEARGAGIAAATAIMVPSGTAFDGDEVP